MIWEAVLHDVGSVDFVLFREIIMGGFVFVMCVNGVSCLRKCIGHLHLPFPGS